MKIFVHVHRAYDKWHHKQALLHIDCIGMLTKPPCLITCRPSHLQVTQPWNFQPDLWRRCVEFSFYYNNYVQEKATVQYSNRFTANAKMTTKYNLRGQTYRNEAVSCLLSFSNGNQPLIINTSQNCKRTREMALQRDLLSGMIPDPLLINRQLLACNDANEKNTVANKARQLQTL